jgi:hypothetical protein
MNTTWSRQRGGNLENAAFEAKLIPGVEHTGAELEPMIGEGIELEG